MERSTMATYVLVHGAWHGGWCWHRIVARLQRASHRVMAPDLLSLGIDATPPELVTLRAWTDQIAALAESANEPIVLVGHSRGGIVLSEVAERIPEHIRVLAYVTAFLLEDGHSLVDCVAEQPDSLVTPAMIVADDHQTATLRDDAIREAFYGRCSDDDAALARSLLKPEPLAPLATPVRTTAARFGRVPRVYVECAADRAITHAAQRHMQSALPCRERVTLESDHSPFFCCPDELAAVLLRL
jgi:pimeloyl-ACP methyl ester carboxylesterase